jgi:hypothetical protein
MGADRSEPFANADRKRSLPDDGLARLMQSLINRVLRKLLRAFSHLCADSLAVHVTTASPRSAHPPPHRPFSRMLGEPMVR